MRTKTYKNILLTGCSGKLGQAIIQSNLSYTFLIPSRITFDLTKVETMERYFAEREIDAVIHCAAVARIEVCEKNPSTAIETNIIGTSKLVQNVLTAEKKVGKSIRFIHISTDGIYPGVKGAYAEEDAAIPYNHYGWSKLGAECAVRVLQNFCIIRTNFFDPEHIQFKTSAIDIYNSKMKIDDLARAIIFLLESDFIGVLNVGDKRMSDFDRYKLYCPEIEPCTRMEIFARLPFKIATDSSLDCTRWKQIQKIEFDEEVAR